MKSRCRGGPCPFAAFLAGFLAVLVLIRLTPAARAASDTGPTPARNDSLAVALGRFLAAPTFARATWGIQVAEADSGTVLFATNAHRLLKPGSNAKLFTAALALDRLGPDYRIPTQLLLDGRVTRRGTLRGDLVIRGQGDFSFAARFHGGDARLSLRRFSEVLRAAGIRRIEGDLIADDEVFASVPFGNGWNWDDLQYYYGAEISALSVDDNVIDLEFRPGLRAGDPVTLQATPPTPYLEWVTRELRTVPPGGPRAVTVTRAPGSREVQVSGTLPVEGPPWKDAVSVPEPGRFFALRLREELTASGIRVRGKPRHEAGAFARHSATTNRNASARRVLRVESPPLRELVPAMLKPSQNLYAQLLLLQVGFRESAGNPPVPNPEATGLTSLRRFLMAANIPPEEVLLDDGSGLSRSSLVTPSAMVELLRAMDHHAQREAFLLGLSVAGVDGTLRTRLKGTPTEGNLRAKTGSLRYVNALSGFVTNSTGRRLVFSLLLNAYEPGAGEASGRAAIDSVARLIAECP